MTVPTESAYADKVRETFEQTEGYLIRSRHNIKIRTETVKEFVRGCHYGHILDIGCGDGSVSIPLLSPENRLTLVDLSAAMLSAARARVPSALLRNVDFVNDDFLKAALARQYDLILCIGLLAHVRFPSSVVAKMGSLLKPNGSVIAQSTDCSHPVSRVLHVWGRVRGWIAPSPYRATFLSADEFLGMFAHQKFRLVEMYRYSSPLPGLARVLNQDCMYQMTRWLHGCYPRARNATWGNEYLCRFTAPA